MKVLVRNLNVHDFHDKREHPPVFIKAGEAVEMDFDYAHTYLGKYYPVLRDANNLPDERSYKKLRIEKIEGEEVKAETPKFLFHRTGEVFATQQELNAAIDKFMDDLADTEEKEKRQKQNGPKKA